MLDLPGIIEGAKDGKGRGRQVIHPARKETPPLEPFRDDKRWAAARQEYEVACLLSAAAPLSGKPSSRVGGSLVFRELNVWGCEEKTRGLLKKLRYFRGDVSSSGSSKVLVIQPFRCFAFAIAFFLFM